MLYLRNFRAIGPPLLVSFLVSIAFSVVLLVGSPTNTARAESINSLSAGDTHTCAVLADGTAECWGNNSRGQLGGGSTTDSVAAVPVTERSANTS